MARVKCFGGFAFLFLNFISCFLLIFYELIAVCLIIFDQIDFMFWYPWVKKLNNDLHFICCCCCCDFCCFSVEHQCSKNSFKNFNCKMTICYFCDVIDGFDAAAAAASHAWFIRNNRNVIHDANVFGCKLFCCWASYAAFCNWYR